MDPAAPLQPYTPPPGGGTPLPAGGSAAFAPAGPAQVDTNFGAAPAFGATPAVGSAQPYLNSATPPPAYQPPLQQLDPLPAGPVGGDVPTTDIKGELVERLRAANNVLVTVSNNPTVDQLAAAIGITLVLNKLDKHATAVYSGQTPPALEFLEPSKTIEKNTDSLRDFIIALDKAKADKLRYKVEDKFVKIFITPYHTSLSESDLEFSQGDFNVDVVLALGVHKREELDQAITAHGRILHDAVTVSVNNEQPSDLGAINWFQADASSLCEMLVSLVEPLQGDKALLDEQVATSFLTGVVAETERFSNGKTSPYTMNISATLMKAGANQQLVSSKLEAPQPVPEDKVFDKAKLDELAKEPGAAAPIPTVSKDGSLEIDHKKEDQASNQPSKTLQDLEKENKNSTDEDENSDLAKIHIDDEGKLISADKPAQPATEPAAPAISSNMVMHPPSLGGAMSAIEKPDDGSGMPAVDTPPEDRESLQHARTVAPLTEEEKAATLADIEQSVHSEHVSTDTAPTPLADEARQAVATASANSAADRPEPISALNAMPIDLDSSTPVPTTTEEAFPPQLVGPDRGLPADPTAAAGDPTAPPPVPPPMMPPQ